MALQFWSFRSRPREARQVQAEINYDNFALGAPNTLAIELLFMKIVTYNLQFNGAGKQDWQPVLALEPDLLLVQESLAPPDNLAAQSAWQAPAKYKWGSAVYVKKGIVSRLEIQHDHDWLPGWLAGVEVADGLHPLGSSKKLRIFSLHAPPRKISGWSYPETVMQMLDVIKINRGDADLVVGGDFNLCIGERHPSETNLRGERWSATKDEQGIQKRLEEFGLINCWQTANPAVPLQQTLRWASNPVPAYHCDGLFVPATWKSALQCSSILSTEEWTGRGKEIRAKSDHNPVVATFSQKTE